MHTFQINLLIQFFLSSARFERRVFMIRKTICTCSLVCIFFMHLCKQSSRWKDVLDRVFVGVRYIIVSQYTVQ